METEDLYKAISAFLMCFGQGLPDELKSRIHQRAIGLAHEIENGGEPNVAKFLTGLADGFYPQMPTH